MVMMYRHKNAVRRQRPTIATGVVIAPRAHHSRLSRSWCAKPAARHAAEDLGLLDPCSEEANSLPLPAVAAVDLGLTGRAFVELLSALENPERCLEAAHCARAMIEQLVLSLEGLDDLEQDSWHSFVAAAYDEQPPALRWLLDIQPDTEAGSKWLTDLIPAAIDLIALAEAFAGIYYRTHADPRRGARIVGALAAARVAVTRAQEINESSTSASDAADDDHMTGRAR